MARRITYNDEDVGKQIGDALAEAIGGSGGIVALQGVLDGPAAAKDRVRRARGVAGGDPDIELLDRQTADFYRDEATRPSPRRC